jgi:hypothetical protein
MLDKADVAICDDIHRLIGGISEISSHAVFSMAYYSCMRRAEFLAGAIPPRLTKYFCAKIDEKRLWAFASALGTDLLVAPEDAVPDAAFTADRAQLPARLGGAGISLLSNRHLYLNMLTTILPQLIDRVEEDGTVTPGLFNDQAARILGQGPFDHANKENRWRTFLASDSALAVEFRDEFERAKAINLELRSRIVLAADEVLPVSIFDGPIEGFGADISKLHKRMMEELDEFRSQDLPQRADNLPITDPRQMVFYANSKDPFSKSLLNGLPVPNTHFTHKQWSKIMALHFGIPIPALRAHVGKHIQSGKRRGGPFIVDAHGHNFQTAPALLTGHIQRNHNGICSTISDGLREARCPHLGGGTDRTCKGVFRNTCPLVTNEDARNKINGIIPDIVIQAGHLSPDEHPLAG